jgi:polar amino acid transport system permease protein
MIASIMLGLEHVGRIVLILLGGAVVAVEITLGALVVALALGLVLAIAKASKLPILQRTVDAFVEVFRSVPALTQLFILYYGLAYLGVKIASFPAAVIGLGLIGAANLAEVFRAGFAALHHGQREAALAVGMTPLMAMRHIIFPQAWRIVLPPIGNYAIHLIKETSVVSAIAAPEIMFFARQLISNTFETTLVYVLTAALYFCLSFPLARIVDRLERRRRAWL